MHRSRVLSKISVALNRENSLNGNHQKLAESIAVDSIKIGAVVTYRHCGIEGCDLIVTDKSRLLGVALADVSNYPGLGRRRGFY